MSSGSDRPATPVGFQPRLSGVRGLASGSVFASHALGAVGILSFPWLGWVGVAGFLSLSIFLLMRSLDADSNLGRYFRRRALRIWPLYWGTCAVVFLLFDRNLTRLLLNAAFVAIYVPGGQFHTGTSWDPNFVLWTLQVEEAAYLFFPLLHRLPRTPQRTVGWGLIGASAVYFGIGWIGAHQFGWTGAAQPFVLGHNYSLPFGWLCCYGAGLLAYGGMVPKGRWALAALLAPLAIATGRVPFEAGVFLLLPLLASVLCTPPRWLESIPLVILGESSYALYLTHALWLQVFGIVGAIAAFPAAFLLEAASRPRTMRKRLRFRDPFVFPWTRSWRTT